MQARATPIPFEIEVDAQRSSGTIGVAEKAGGTFPSPSCRYAEKPVVLIVDDDQDLRESLVRMLAECDLSAVGATSSIEALEILQHAHVDIVVSDQFTWGIDGVSLLSTVRQRWPQVRRILFTADASPDIMLAAVNRGGVHKVLLKTMHAVQIRDEIEGVALDALRRRTSHE
jgi:two-component system response regulator HupR/HoxA